MTGSRFVSVVAAVIASLVSACGPAEDDTPDPNSPCIAMPEDVRYTLSLVEDYDERSSQYYDPTLPGLGVTPNVYSPEGSDEAAVGYDGLVAGATVTFTSGRYSPGYTLACSYREMDDVAGVHIHPGRYRESSGGVEGVTAAGWTRDAIINDERTPYTLLLLAPTGDPLAPRQWGELPTALLVRRGLGAHVWVVEVTEDGW